MNDFILRISKIILIHLFVFSLFNSNGFSQNKEAAISLALFLTSQESVSPNWTVAAAISAAFVLVITRFEVSTIDGQHQFLSLLVRRL